LTIEQDLFRRAHVVVPGVVPGATAAALVARAREESVRRFSFSTAFEAHSVGRILDQAAGDLEEYFREAQTYEALVNDVAGPDLRARVFAALATVAGGPLSVPADRDGRPYAWSTLRWLPRGGVIPPHCEREQMEQPTHAELRAQTTPGAIWSWYALLAAPGRGGELALHDVRWDSPQGRAIYADRGAARQHLPVARADRVAPAAGSLVVFNGSLHFHEVLAVEEGPDRWTLGGFLLRRRAGGYFVFS